MTTAEERINAIGNIDEKLLEGRIFFLKKYITVKEYLKSYFKDTYEFDADKLASLFGKRINSDGEEYIKYICNDILTDEKYHASVRKGENFSQSFVDYIKMRNPNSLADLDHIPHGTSTKNIEELYDIFSNNRYIEEELEEVIEPSEEEQMMAVAQSYVGNVFYEVITENSYDLDKIKDNGSLINYIFGDFINTISNIEEEYTNGTLKSKIENELKKVYIKRDDRSDVDKLEYMEVGAGYVTTPSALILTTKERNAVAAVIGNTKSIVMSGDEDEEVETVDEPEETVYLDEAENTTSMRAK